MTSHPGGRAALLARLAKAAAIASGIAATLALTLALSPQAPGSGYAVLVALFCLAARHLGREAGYWAVGVTALAVAYFLLEGEGFAIIKPADSVRLILMVSSGILAVSLVGALASRAAAADARAAGLEARDARRAALLAELSHRIGNDLGTLVSVAELQATRAAHPETRDALAGTADRIHVLGKVYGRLRVITGGDATLDMAEFLEGLCEDLEVTHLGLRPVSLHAEVGCAVLPANQAVLVGLVLNEAVTNALKHAFPDDRPGSIVARFGTDPDDAGLVRLEVRDDGVGPDAVAAAGAGMGQRLMRGMASQLRGTYALAREDGWTVSRLRFPPQVPGEGRRR